MATSASLENLDFPETADTKVANHIKINVAHLSVVKLLIASENSNTAEFIKSALVEFDCSVQIHRVASIDDLNVMLAQNSWDLVIAFNSSHIFSPDEVRHAVACSSIDISSIYIDSHHTAQNASLTMQLGFHDYLTEDHPEMLKFAIAREANAIRCIRKAKVADEHMAEATAANHLLLDSTSDAIAYISDGIIIHANPSFLDTLSYESPDEVEWQPFIDIVAEPDRINMRGILKKIATNSVPESTVTVGIAASNGEIMPTKLSFASAAFEGDTCTQVLLHTDIPLSNCSLNTQTLENNVLTTEASRSNPGNIEAPYISAVNSTIVNAAIHSNENENIVDVIASLSGKGSIGFAALKNHAKIQRKMGFDKYYVWLDHLSNLIIGELKEHLVFLNRSGETWSFVVSDSISTSNASNLLCEKLNSAVANEADNEEVYVALGVSCFGIAELSPNKALYKSFSACAAQQTKGKGVEIISPKIDNAEASEALISALDLNRVKLKYQPIVGLQNQSSHYYAVYPYIQNDAGREQPAQDLIDELGTEHENTKFDRWVVNEIIDQFKNQPIDQINASAAIPLTTSALLDESFKDWLVERINSEQIPNEYFCFYIKPIQLADYEEKAQSLFETLSNNKIACGIFNCENLQKEQLETLKPNIIQISDRLTKNLMNSEVEGAREALLAFLQLARDASCQSICSGVESAAELAQLWQTGVPFVQGNYLQSPLSEMTYEFSEIG